MSIEFVPRQEMQLELKAIHQELTTLNLKVDTLTSTVERQTAKTDDRLQALEKWRYFLTGGFAVLTFFVGGGAVTTAVVYALSR